ncbi:MAG: prolyl oligopeptidase family serine peptidase [Lentisphaeria bacterium]
MSKQQKIYSILIECILFICVFLPEITGRKNVSGNQNSCSTRIAKKDLQDLILLAKKERHRAKYLSGTAARQAEWLCVKAEYAVYKSNQMDSNNPEIAAECRDFVHTSCGRLLYASNQSRQGMRTIYEEPGAKLRAYRSKIDESLQTYSISIPAVYDERVSWPLIVSMHGHGWFRPFQGHPAPCYKGAFVLSPQGRGATDYKDLGEEDVLAAIAEVKKDYNIDSDRVYLKGGSMGGTGCFNLAVHYADQFAGIFPIVGNADNRAWTARWGWNTLYPGRNNTLRDFLQKTHSAVPFAGNLQHLPAYILAGSGDTVVPPEHSENMAAALRAAGYNVEYREYPNCGHGGFSDFAVSEGLAWTCGWRRNAYPREVRWKASSLRYGKAYWLRMDQMAHPLEMAEMLGKVTAPNHVQITVANLLSFSVCCNDILFNPCRPLFLEINGQRVIFPPWSSQKSSLVWRCLRYDVIHGWDVEEHFQIPELRKVCGMEGPIHDALLDPFILVVGTQSPIDGMNEIWKREADQFVFEWQRRNNAPCLITEDEKCTPEMVESRNLILFGGARDNSVSALFAGVLPLTEMYEPLRKDSFYQESDNVGHMIVYPAGNYSPGHLMVEVSANTPTAAFQVWGRFGNWFNWGVYDSKKYFDYAIFDGRSSSPETMLLVGWFGTDWRINSGEYFLGNRQLRLKNGSRTLPRYDSIQECKKLLHLNLTDLFPKAVDQMRGAIGWNVHYWGERLTDAASCFGIRAPSSITFDMEDTFREFSAVVCMDNAADHFLTESRRKTEKVRFVVWGDDQVKGEATVDWQNPEMELKADITGVAELKLTAEPGGGPSWLHSAALWKNPIVQK